MTRKHRHHNNRGLRQAQRGKTARLPRKMGRILIKGGEMNGQKESPKTVAPRPENTPEVSATAGEMSRGKTVSDDILHEQRVRIAADNAIKKILADGDVALAQISEVMKTQTDTIVALVETIKPLIHFMHVSAGHKISFAACPEDACRVTRENIEAAERAVAKSSQLEEALKG